MAITLTAPEWAAAAYADGPGGLPAPVLGAWIDGWLWLPMLAMQFVFLPALLPSGRPASRRMARLLIMVAVVVGGWTVAAMVQGELRGPQGGRIDNPVGMLAIADVEDVMSGGALAATFGLAMTLTGVAVILRYRRSRAVERMQLRWVLLGASASVFGFVVIGFVEALLPMHRIWLDAVVVPVVPISIGVAVSKYGSPVEVVGR